MNVRICCAITVLAIVVAAVPLAGHHSPSAIFDMSKRITMTGVLTKVDWINPHITMSIDVKTESGKTETWNFESNPPLWFKKVGVNRADVAKSLGQPIKVEFNRAKDQSIMYGYLYKITFQNGSSLELTNADYPR